VTALLLALSKRNFIELRRYAFDTTFQFGGIFFLFMLVFWGARGLGGSDIRDGDALPAIVVGFIVLTVVLGSYGTMANWMMMEATLGTLEQIAMSPFGLLMVLVAEYVASLGAQFAVTAIMLVAAELFTGQWLHLDALTLIPLVALLLVQMLGLSVAVGGVALVFKRVVSLTNLLQFGFLAMVSLPVEQYPWVRVMPIGLANHLIRESTVHGTGLLDLERTDLAQLVVIAFAYLAAGIAVFLRMEHLARDRGAIGVH